MFIENKINLNFNINIIETLTRTPDIPILEKFIEHNQKFHNKNTPRASYHPIYQNRT